jgi:hypothetical protein
MENGIVLHRASGSGATGEIMGYYGIKVEDNVLRACYEIDRKAFGLTKSFEEFARSNCFERFEQDVESRIYSQVFGEDANVAFVEDLVYWNYGHPVEGKSPQINIGEIGGIHLFYDGEEITDKFRRGASRRDVSVSDPVVADDGYDFD